MKINTLSNIIFEATEKFLSNNDFPTPPLSNQQRREITGKLTEKVRDAVMAANGQLTKQDRYKVPRELYAEQIAMLICRFEPVVRIITSPMDRFQTRPALYIADGPDAGTYSIADDVIRRVVNAWSNDIGDVMFKKIYKKLNQCAPLSERTIDPDLVPVNNGVFDYRTKQLLPFSPDYVFLSKCRVNYNPDAAKVVIHNDDDNTDWDVDSWMDELSDDPEIVNLLWEVIGASIRPYVPWNKSAWFYATSGNNGKGTLCSLMRDLIGVESCAALSIKDFGDRFGLGGLVSATAVINDENDVDAINGNLGKFKAVITGDAITIEKKFEHPFPFRFYGMVIQCFNGFPTIKDNGEALYRRVLSIM